MANAEHVAKLKEGVEAWNEWRASEAGASRPDLSDADLRGADLTGADLSEADLSGADLRSAHLPFANLSEANLVWAILREADLRYANLIRANLSEANLSHDADLARADLSGAYLYGADLSKANLREANLRSAHLPFSNLSQADLRGADLSFAMLSGTVFGFTSLMGAIIDNIRFLGACPLDPETVIRSGGLPDSFLRGCGWSDRLIEYWPSIMAAGIGLYSAMISYSSTDRAFARKLYESLRDRHVRVWRDEHEIMPGDDVRDSIDRGVRLYDKLILICSESSLSSYWVDRELYTALTEEERLWKERDERVLKLVPVALDDSWRTAEGSRIAVVRERHVEDFSDWENDEEKYKAAFERVLRALEPGSKIPPPDPEAIRGRLKP